MTLTLTFQGHYNAICNGTNGLSIYAFLLVFNSNIWRNSAPLWDIMLQNLSDLDFDLSMSLKVNCDGVIGLPIFGFLLRFNCNIGLYYAHLRDKRLQNLSDLDQVIQGQMWRRCHWSPHICMVAYYCLIVTQGLTMLLWDTCIRLRNLGDLEFDLSRPLKVKCDCAIELKHGFLLVSN